MYDVLAPLARAELDACVFGSAVGAFYGLTRPARDVDVLVRATLSELRAVFPNAEVISKNGLAIGSTELWSAPLRFVGNARLAFDDALSARRTWLDGLGWVLSPEDQLVIKLILQRREEKNDLEDARALLARWSSRLDRRYVAWRAERCRASARVRRALAELSS